MNASDHPPPARPKRSKPPMRGRSFLSQEKARVACWVGEGQTAGFIARQIGASPHAVYKQVRSLGLSFDFKAPGIVIRKARINEAVALKVEELALARGIEPTRLLGAMIEEILDRPTVLASIVSRLTEQP